MKVKVSYSFDCNRIGSERTDSEIIEVPDGSTDSDIEIAAENAAKEWMWSFVELGYESKIQWDK
jgi:hypothetical protein